ncbi:MAG: hypothetical protein GWQ05_03260, partial [Verrucomicrobiaceae bacterium]|nr:hypothetical protein [Verrucomicrobiaceae bacterium]
MGKRIVDFMMSKRTKRRGRSGSVGSKRSIQQKQGKAKTRRPSEEKFNVVTFAPGVRKPAYGGLESAGEETEIDEEIDAAAKNAIVAATRKMPRTHSNHSIASSGLDVQSFGSLGADHSLAGHDLTFQRSESAELEVKLLNFPPEEMSVEHEKPHGETLDDSIHAKYNAALANSHEMKAKLKEITETLQTVREDKETIQSKYDTLLKSSAKIEQDLRIGERSEPEQKLDTVIMEARTKDGALSSLMSERDKLALKVEESERMIARLKTEKAEAVANSKYLADNLKELQERFGSLSTELSSSNNAQSEFDKREERNIDDAKELLQVKDQVKMMNVQISQVNTRRDILAAKYEEATTKLSDLQLTCRTLKADRDRFEAKSKELARANIGAGILGALDSEKAVLTSKIDECIARLYAQNKDEESGCDSDTDGVSFSPDEKLARQLRAKDREISLLRKNNERLEGYTKQTLAIFQEKYFSTQTSYTDQLDEKD